jgi:Holliday junction resolvasome RuvABC ATP-dependent DNA helicase subunit
MIWILILFFICWFLTKDKQAKNIPDYSESWDFSKEGDKEELTAVLKQPSFDISRIQEYHGENVKQFEFRPGDFKEFIGQEETKNKLRTAIKKIKAGMKCHFFGDGIRGHGKTTLFQKVLPNELGKEDTEVIYRVGKQVNQENLPDIINQINKCKKKYPMFIIDEIDTMDWRDIKILNPIIESFEIAGKKIKPFIFIGITINKHLLIDKVPDTLDRISTHIKFSKYNASEIGRILAQYQKQLYPEAIVPQEVIEIISKNCKFNPRTSIALLEDYIVECNMVKVLKNSKIIQDGLTKMDIKILIALSKSSRALGANSLAQRVGLSPKEYMTEFEPFLCEYNYI